MTLWPEDDKHDSLTRSAIAPLVITKAESVPTLTQMKKVCISITKHYCESIKAPSDSSFFTLPAHQGPLRGHLILARF